MHQMASLIGKVATTGKVYVVCPTTDPSYDRISQLVTNDPDGVMRLYPTLQSLLTADPFVTGQNDAVILSGYNTHALTGLWTQSKGRIHFYGLDWLLGDKRREQQSTKIEITGATDVAAVLKVTANRASFHGIKFIQSSTHANALACVIDAGEGTLFEDCSGVFGVVDNLDQTNAYELVCNVDTGIYRNCAFGTSVLLTSAARSVVSFERVTGSASGDAAKNFRFEDCLFKIMSSSATASLTRIASTNAVKFENVMKNCEWIAAINQSAGGITLNDANTSVSGLVEGNILVINPATNCTKFGDTVTDNIKVVGAATSNVTGIGVTPA
jgi:hypothetical protein